MKNRFYFVKLTRAIEDTLYNINDSYKKDIDILYNCFKVDKQKLSEYEVDTVTFFERKDLTHVPAVTPICIPHEAFITILLSPVKKWMHTEGSWYFSHSGFVRTFGMYFTNKSCIEDSDLFGFVINVSQSIKNSQISGSVLKPQSRFYSLKTMCKNMSSPITDCLHSKLTLCINAICAEVNIPFSYLQENIWLMEFDINCNGFADYTFFVRLPISFLIYNNLLEIAVKIYLSGKTALGGYLDLTHFDGDVIQKFSNSVRSALNAFLYEKDNFDFQVNTQIKGEGLDIFIEANMPIYDYSSLASNFNIYYAKKESGYIILRFRLKDNLRWLKL